MNVHAVPAPLGNHQPRITQGPVPPAWPTLADTGHADRATWPLFAGLGPLGALPTAPRLARAFAALVLWGWGLHAITEDAELIASELSGNVVRAATGADGHPLYGEDGRLPVLWLRLLSDKNQLSVEVWDSIPDWLGVPAERHAGPDDESGRGLEIVRELTLDWGWEHVPGLAAKRVWALLSTQPAAT